MSILGSEPSSMRSTTQIAPNPKASPITPPGMSVFCAAGDLFRDRHGVALRFDLRVADAPCHQGGAVMDQLAAGELALGRLDRAVQLPTLADPDDALERDPTFLAGELVDGVDDADRVNGDGLLLRQQPLGFDLADDVGNRGDVGAGRLDDGQSSVPFKVEETRGDLLAALQHDLVRPGTRPGEPASGSAFPASLREWDGIEHTVTVIKDGFDWQGRKFKSLSAVARAITSTQWNGYRFFGLREGRRGQQ